MRKPVVFSRRKNRNSRPVNPFLRDVVRSFRKTIAAVFVFSFFLNLLTLTVPIFLIQIYDKVLPGRNFDTLIFLTGIAMVAVVAFGLLESVRRTVLSKLGVRFDNDVSEHLLSSAINRSGKNSSTNVNIMRDLATVRRFLSGSAMFPLLDLPWTPIFVLILYVLHPVLGMFGLAGVVILFAIAVLNEFATRDGVKATRIESRDLLDKARTYLRNSDVVTAMGMQASILKSWKDNNAEMLSSTYKNGRTNTRLLLVSKMLRLALQIGIIGTAAWLILNQELTPGGTFASLLILRRAIAPVESSISSWKAVISARAAYSNISNYLDSSSSLDNTRDMPEPGGELVAHKVSFRRSNQDLAVLNRIEMRISPAQITAVVGRTAEGKSTLIRLLAGIVKPTNGKVTLGGYELDQWSAEQLGPCIGYLPQDVCLFPGSVRDNISRLVEQPIDDVIAAAKMAQAHEMIQSLPNGYETIVSEDGLNLSGGQRQRIGLARAVFGGPKVVLLDEPDANLDESGRKLLRVALREMKAQKMAVLVITHHTSLEELADRVYKLENRKVTLLRSKKVSAATQTGDQKSDKTSEAANSDRSSQSSRKTQNKTGQTKTSSSGVAANSKLSSVKVAPVTSIDQGKAKSTEGKSAPAKKNIQSKKPDASIDKKEPRQKTEQQKTQRKTPERGEIGLSNRDTPDQKTAGQKQRKGTEIQNKPEQKSVQQEQRGRERNTEKTQRKNEMDATKIEVRKSRVFASELEEILNDSDAPDGIRTSVSTKSAGGSHRE